MNALTLFAYSYRFFLVLLFGLWGARVYYEEIKRKETIHHLCRSRKGILGRISVASES